MDTLGPSDYAAVRFSMRELHWPPGRHNLVVVWRREGGFAGRVFVGAEMVEPTLEDKIAAMHLGSLSVTWRYVESWGLS